MSALREKIHEYVDEIPESKLTVLRPLLSELANDAIVIETDLTDEEKRLVAEGIAEYDGNPDSFISLADFKAEHF
jgi:predicted Zn-dependent peptidase